MEATAVIGIDLAKSVFQVHGVDAQGQVVLRKRLSRAIALANKIGRTAWALMTSGERYREPVVA